MDDVLRELLHASVQWRHTRALCDQWKAGAGDDDRIPSALLGSMTNASNRLRAASLAAERAYGPDGIVPDQGEVGRG